MWVFCGSLGECLRPILPTSGEPPGDLTETREERHVPFARETYRRKACRTVHPDRFVAGLRRLDAAGCRQQSLAPGYAPLVADHVLVGCAFPVRVEAIDEIPNVPYVGLLAALDAIGPGEVWVGTSGGFRDASL